MQKSQNIKRSLPNTLKDHYSGGYLIASLLSLPPSIPRSGCAPQAQKSQTVRGTAGSARSLKALVKMLEENQRKDDEIFRRIYQITGVKNYDQERHWSKALKDATPHWLTEEHHNMIKLIYKQAKQLTETTGIEHHVDHIVPLRGKKISGLHVPWNLQILTKRENLKKSNKVNYIYEDRGKNYFDWDNPEFLNLDSGFDEFHESE
tara:strand:+ start:50 stop:664 length:615 start_codon:yes stop_codon:yes gene_type:complete